MHNESMDVAKIVAHVIILAMLISVVYIIFQSVYNSTAKNTTKLADNISALDSQTLGLFDDKIVTGTDVLTALKLYRGDDVHFAICIATLVCQDDSWDNIIAQDEREVRGYYNYDAMIGDNIANTLAHTPITYYKESSKLKVDADLSGTKYIDFSKTAETGSPETYVRQNTKWYAKLIYNRLDEPTGIYFIELNE